MTAAARRRDQAGPLRADDAFEPARALAFLQAHISDLPAGPLQLLQFHGGASNRTYLLRIGPRELILRRPPASASAGNTHKLAHEVRVLSALAAHFPCPRPLCFCTDEGLIGSSFFVMEKIDGLILRRDLPPDFLCSPEQARRLGDHLFDTLSRLHEIDYAAIGLADLGQPQGYVERQVRGWSERFENSRTDDAPRCETVKAWLEQHMPADAPQPALIHNDYRFDNVVLSSCSDANIVGVLDWETCTIGDPLMDLGNSLAYWIQADHPEPLQKLRAQPSHLPGMPTRDDIVRRYADRSGRQIDCFDFYYVFGLFRLAVIAQQIYFRYRCGTDKNPRFEAFGLLVTIITRHAEKLISKSKL